MSCGHDHCNCSCQHGDKHHGHDDHHDGGHGGGILDAIEDRLEQGLGIYAFFDSIAEGFKSFMRDVVVPTTAWLADTGIRIGVLAAVAAAGFVAITAAAPLLAIPAGAALTAAAVAVPTLLTVRNYWRGGWTFRVANTLGTGVKDAITAVGDGILFAPGRAVDAPDGAEPELEPNSRRVVEGPEGPIGTELREPVVSPEHPEVDAAEATDLPWQKARATRAVNEHNLYTDAYAEISHLDISNPRAASLEAKRIACAVIGDSLAQNDHRGRALHFGIKRDGLRAVATGEVRGIQNIQEFLARQWVQGEVVREFRAPRGDFGVAA